MLSEIFWFYQKNSFIKKVKSVDSHKIKSAKKLRQKFLKSVYVRGVSSWYA